MAVDNLTGLAARDEMFWVARQWNRLRARLRPGGGNALTGMPKGGSSGVPIDVGVSDLMRDIEDKARFYGQVLADETDWAPTTSTMPRLLVEVAQRYGHFTAGDERMALDFCDDAHDMHDKVRRTLEQPAPPTYVGPCQTSNCAGELYVREGRDAGTCRECGTAFTLVEQRDWLKQAMADRLMTREELPRALKILGHDLPAGIVAKWIERDRLTEAVEGEGLYHLEDAARLADAYKPRRRAA